MPRRAPTRTEIERRVAELAETLQWLHHHGRCPGRTRDGYIDGFPGEVLVRGNRLVLLTIVDRRGQLSAPEAAWTTALATVNTVESHIVRPTDLRHIAELLRRQAPQRSARENDVRPTARGEKPRQAPSQEESCERQTAS